MIVIVMKTLSPAMKTSTLEAVMARPMIDAAPTWSSTRDHLPNHSFRQACVCMWCKTCYISRHFSFAKGIKTQFITALDSECISSIAETGSLCRNCPLVLMQKTEYSILWKL